MPIFQAKRTHPTTGTEESVFVDAPDRMTAFAALRRRGWPNADWLDQLPPGADLPDGIELIRATPMLRGTRRPLRRLADSGLVRRPILTIAAGVGLGIVAGVVMLTILSFLLGLLGFAVS